MSDTRIELTFAGEGDVQLVETRFYQSAQDPARVTIRGKTSGAFLNTGSFQWTSAVRALCILLLRTKLYQLVSAGKASAQLSGTQGSLAASLDYAMTRRPTWIIDMFGSDKAGSPLINRIIARTNSNRKRPGPVVLAINHKMLAPDGISISWNNEAVTMPESLHTLLLCLRDIDQADIQEPSLKKLRDQLAA